MANRARTQGWTAVTRRLAAIGVVAVASACSSGGDDGTSSFDVADTEADATATETTPVDEPSIDESSGSESADTVPEEAGDTEPSTDTDVGADTEAVDSTQLGGLVADAQALCDAIDQDAVRSVVGDFVELRPDDLFQEDRNLCQVMGDRFPVAGIWVFQDAGEREFLQDVAADPYEPCQVGGYEAACQTHTGDPELFNGWPTVFIGVGSMAVEFNTPDPVVAQELAAALVEDLVGTEG